MNLKQRLAALLRKWAGMLDHSRELTTQLHLEVTTCKPLTIAHYRVISPNQPQERVHEIKNHMRRAIAAQLTMLYGECIAITETPTEDGFIALTAKLRVLKPTNPQTHNPNPQTTMKKEQLKCQARVVNRRYGTVETVLHPHALLKDSAKGWIPCVIYYGADRLDPQGSIKVFCKEQGAFLEEFDLDEQ